MKPIFRSVIVLSFFGLSPLLVNAQTVVEHTGWMSVFNTTKFNSKWGMQFDMQFRMANDFKYLKNVLLRPALIYSLDKSNNIGVGYVFYGSYPHSSTPNTVENRVYEQFIHTQSIKATAITQRFRLEQRFIGRVGAPDLFAQRFRYFVRAVIPLAKQKSTFKQGIYGALQDEIFVNVQNKDQLNGSMFDQNRALGAIGYRFSPRIDMEIGYMNQLVKRTANNLSNNVAQLTFYTRF